MQIVVLFLVVSICRAARDDVSDLPDGYFPFEESPSRTPPKVRRPPYAQADIDCPGNFYYFKNRIIIRIHGNLVVVR